MIRLRNIVNSLGIVNPNPCPSGYAPSVLKPSWCVFPAYVPISAPGGRSDCQQCLNKDQDVVWPCPPGYYLKRQFGGPGAPCPDNQKQSTRQGTCETCLTCSAGYTPAWAGAPAPPKCNDQGPNATQIEQHEPGNYNCSKCVPYSRPPITAYPAGQFASGSGSGSCAPGFNWYAFSANVPACSPATNYELVPANGSGVCHRCCPAGTYVPPGSSKCISTQAPATCPSGWNMEQSASFLPSSCPDGSQVQSYPINDQGRTVYCWQCKGAASTPSSYDPRYQQHTTTPPDTTPPNTTPPETTPPETTPPSTTPPSSTEPTSTGPSTAALGIGGLALAGIAAFLIFGSKKEKP